MISAVFEHVDCKYRFEERYPNKKSFLKALKRKDATLLHATDFERGVAVYPSTLWDYRNLMT